MPPKKNIIPVEYMKATYNKVHEKEKPDFLSRCAALEKEIYEKNKKIDSWEAKLLVIQVERPRFLEKVKMETKLLIRKNTNMTSSRSKLIEPMSESDAILKKTIDNILDREMYSFYCDVERTKKAIILEDPTTGESDAELKAYKKERAKLRKKVVEEAINGEDKLDEKTVADFFDIMDIGEEAGPF
jgi:hypothetical protein